MPQIPVWQLPEFEDRSDSSEEPAWLVVFLFPTEDEERDQFMQQLITIDQDWPYRPEGSPRRLLQVPWLMDTSVSSSIICSIVKRAETSESMIFVDEQSRTDNSVILVHYDESEDAFQTVRAPINRANMLLVAAAGEDICIDGLVSLPENPEEGVLITQRNKCSSEESIFILESMTGDEIQKIETALLAKGLHDDFFTWVDVSSKLESPDMEGLIAYFESEENEFRTPPSYFLAVDREAVRITNLPAEKQKRECPIILASKDGGRLSFGDELGDTHSRINLGYGFQALGIEEAINASVNLSVGNMDFEELAPGPEYVYWLGYQAWVDQNLDDYEDGEKSFDCAWVPGQGRIDVESYE
ncbi:hypothetical protein N7478_011418 [Penicillium angulare]|uniref:uncharacterized protein n=1 Tax=Penicillium angulare TaxID=116970 RepID=UPI0025418305|nr:uncharacterized protein N7478_011418 [Penicillium angulare]KAJ5263813.1 hypothetical protein N7478_011418 [Penicillium angulare]